MPHHLADKRFWKDIGRGFLPRNAGSRVGQVLSHGVTDAAAGISDLVGGHGAADRVRKWQKSMDDTYDSFMDKDFRQEYRDNKIGRAAGELASSMVPGILGGYVAKAIPSSGILGKLDKATKLRRAGFLSRRAGRLAALVSGKANNPVSRFFLKPKTVSGLRGTGFLGKLIKIPGVEPKLLARLLSNRQAMAALGGVSGLAGHVRGGSIDTRDVSVPGDLNPVMKAKDLLSREWLLQRAALGSDRDYGRAYDAMKKFDALYRPSGENDGARPMTRGGNTVFRSDGYGDLGGRYMLGGSNEQRRMERLMSLANRHAASKESGSFGTSWLGQALGFESPLYDRTPGVELVDRGDGTKAVRFIPRAQVDENGMRIRDNVYRRIGSAMDARSGGGKGTFRHIGSAIASIPQTLAYTATPWTSAAGILHGGAQSGGGYDVGSGAGLMASNLLGLVPAIGRLGFFPSMLRNLGLPIAGSYAGGKLMSAESPGSAAARDRFIDEAAGAYNGGATPDFFANTKTGR